MFVVVVVIISIIIMALGIVSQPSQSTFHSRPQIKLDRFEELVDALKDALGPSSGLDSSDVDVNTLAAHMRVYDTKEKGWVPYAMADPDLPYTRNLVDEGNGKSNLVSHLHPTSHLARLLRGCVPALCVCVRKQRLTVASCLVCCIAGACMDAWQGQPDPRPRKRPLHHEDTPRQPDRVEIRVPRLGQPTTDAADLPA